jgi:ureidoacrylate peracid hydrolase
VLLNDTLAKLEERLDSGHTAILVIDMQNDFCAKGGYVEVGTGLDAAPCRAVVDPINELVASGRAAGVPVIWVKADYSWDKVPPGMRAKALARGTKTLFACSGTWGGEFFGVSPATDELVVEKHTFSAFMGTPLDRQLRALGIRTLVFCGVQTNVCVDSSVRDAAALGFYTVIASDCVASHTQALHDASLKTLGFLFGDVLPREEIVAHWLGTDAKEGGDAVARGSES